MFIDTTRFGEIEVDDTKIVTFTRGLLGFSQFKQYVLFQTSKDSYFYWLQSIETPDLAFVVTDPSLFVPSYRPTIRPDQMHDLGLESVDDAQVLVIVNKYDGMLTGNLQGPLIVHLRCKIGEQLVLSDRRFSTRVPLVELSRPVEAISA